MIIMPIINRVLLDGSYGGYGYIYELDDGQIVFYSNGGYYESGDEFNDYYRSFVESEFGDVNLEDVVAQQWSSQGPKFYFLKDDLLYSQDFAEFDDRVEAVGSLKTERIDELYYLEDQYGVDFDRDNQIGKPPVFIERVLFDGSEYGYGSLFKLEGGEYVFTHNGGNYVEGDEFDDYYQPLEVSDFGDVSLNDAVAMDWGSNGPKLFFWDGEFLHSQEFRDSNGQLEASGSLRSESLDRLHELENRFNQDIDGDDEIGEPPVFIERVLFNGSEYGYGSLFELGGGEYAFYNNGGNYEEGDVFDDYYQRLEASDFGDVSLDDAVAMDWGSNGPKLFFWDGEALYSQAFRDRNGQLETSGRLKSESLDRLHELENNFNQDIDGNDEVGKPPVFIERVLFNGSGYGYGSLFKLEGGEYAFYNNGGNYVEGDEFDDYYQPLEVSDFGDVSLDEVVAMDWRSNGPTFYFWDDNALYSQGFRDLNGQLETSGKLKSEPLDRLHELENIFNKDIDGDDEIGEPALAISSVLFSGEEGNWGHGLYELDDASLVIAEPELEEGDAPIEVRKLVTSNGNDFAIDGDLLGGYGINRGFAVLYSEGASFLRQNFRESGDLARTNGKPKRLNDQQITDLEDEHGVDFNGDGVYGNVPSVISSVLFVGDEGNWGRGLYELDDASLVIAESELEEGDTPIEMLQLVTNKGDDFSVDGDLLGGYGIKRGFAVLYFDGARILRQNFRESGDLARTNGKPKSLNDGQIVDLEDDHGVDFNGDGVYGNVPSEISSVLFAGDEGNWGRGLYELDDASLVVAEAELEEGDTPTEVLQLVTSKGDDFAVDGDLLGGYGVKKGFAVLYSDGARVFRQNFRESGDLARTNGKPKRLNDKQITDLEDDHGVDFNGDGIYGNVPSAVSSVLFAGDEGDWGRGLYELDDASLVVAEAELEEGDTTTEVLQLVTNKGDDFSVDGDLLGGYGVKKGFAVLYSDGARVFRQNFRESGDLARTNGKPKKLNNKWITDLEDDHGVDFNGDGVYGNVPPVISSVLFAGGEGNWGRGLYELDNASLVLAESELEEGDTPIEVLQLVTNKGDNFAVDGDLLGGYGINKGFALLYTDGESILRQNFRESGDFARTNGKPKSLNEKQIDDLENEHGFDFNNDSLIGSEPPVIEAVLFDGLQGDWGRGIYTVEDDSIFIGDQWLIPGDEIIDGMRLLFAGGDSPYSSDGDIVGGYGDAGNASIVYAQDSNYFTQSFGIEGDAAVQIGSPIPVTDGIHVLEDDFGVDFDQDGFIGVAPQ